MTVTEANNLIGVLAIAHDHGKRTSSIEPADEKLLTTAITGLRLSIELAVLPDGAGLNGQLEAAQSVLPKITKIDLAALCDSGQ